MTRANRIIGVILLLGQGSIACGQAVTADSLVKLALKPNQIDVGTFYSGAEVQVSADLHSCNEAVLVMESDPAAVVLNRKDRVAGIWLNVAKVTVSHVPQTYLLAASDELEKVCSAQVREDLQLGKDYLRRTAKITSEKPLSESEFDDFIKLKTEDGTYNLDLRLNLEESGSGTRSLSAVLPIPATVPPGDYEVVLYGLRDGEPVQRGSAGLTIKRVGLTELLVSLAQKHEAEYGVLAIIVAMSVGILMGIVFHSLPGSGH